MAQVGRVAVDAAEVNATPASIVVSVADPTLRAELVRLHEADGHTVHLAPDLSEVRRLVATGSADVVILDDSMPGEWVTAAIPTVAPLVRGMVLLSASGSTDDRVRNLRRGADDVLERWVSAAEIVARSGALLRRNPPPDARELEFGSLRVSPLDREVFLDGESLELSVKELDLLLFLCRHPSTWFSRHELLVAVWGSSSEWQGEATVTEHVRRLRQKTGITMIQTRRGVGYRWVPIDDRRLRAIAS
jgi:two-component system alkaline phosphatase synthesis response regulator PhoP